MHILFFDGNEEDDEDSNRETQGFRGRRRSTMYHRPSTFDECESLYRRSISQPLSGHRETLRLAVDAMLASWMRQALRPLYEANTLVSFLTNTITPSIVELLQREGVFDEMVGRALKSRTALDQHSSQFESIMDRLRAACELAKSRDASCSSEFVAMRDSMSEFAVDPRIRNGMKLLYVAHDTARAIIDMMFGRLEDALINHNEIMHSSDIPFSAMVLAART